MMTPEEKDELERLNTEVPEKRMFRPSNGAVVMVDLYTVDAVEVTGSGCLCHMTRRRKPLELAGVNAQEIVDAVIEYTKIAFRMEHLRGLRE